MGAEIGKIVADFINNSVYGYYSNVGAITNLSSIEDITGNFERNNTYSLRYSSYGGAIYNNYEPSTAQTSNTYLSQYATIENIKGNFIWKNYEVTLQK